MNKLKVFSFPDRNPEYLQLQIDSYKKHIHGEDTELIIINASTNNEDQINRICKDNKITCIRFSGQREGLWDSYYLRQLHWFRDTVQKQIPDNILLIHSDMFFINKLDYKTLMEQKQIYYSPQYRNQFTGTPQVNYKYIWDGIILFNSQYMNDNKLTKYFNWDYIRPITDGGGMMKDFVNLITPKNVHSYLEFWNYTEIKNNIIDTHLNGNVRYYLDIVNDRFITPPNLINRSFEYETERQDYQKYYINNFKDIKKTFIDPYNFPDPAHIDIIQVVNKNIVDGFALHFKSGVGYQSFYNKEYSRKKLIEIEKIINRPLN